MFVRQRSELSPKIASTALVFLLALCSATSASALAPDQAADPQVVAPSSSASAPNSVTPPSYALYAPATLPTFGPVCLLLVLHGVGGNGPDFVNLFAPLADRHGWLLVAPTFVYGDWRDPVQVRSEDLKLSQQLEALVADVPSRSGRTIKDRILVAGFSRGAQLADRFVYFHPEQIAAVASLSAGTYTVPWTRLPSDGSDPLPLPFGTADFPALIGHPLDMNHLRQVPFWLSVGGQDSDPSELPRQWDRLLGQTRLDRAVAFEHALQAVSVPVQLTIYPGVKHQLTGPMTDGVDQFFGAIQSLPPISH